MPEEQAEPRTPEESREGIPKDASRLEMMRRHKRMSVEQRLDVFEALSRDAAWILRSAKRVR